MAGPQSIQRYPAGLLDLLGMRGTGECPHELSGYVLPVVQMDDLYRWQRRIRVGANTTAAPAAAATAYPVGTLDIPQGVIWLITHVSAKTGVVLPAATALGGFPYFNVSGRQFALADEKYASVGEQLVCAKSYDQPLIIAGQASGTTFGFNCTRITGAPALLVSLDLLIVEVGI